MLIQKVAHFNDLSPKLRTEIEEKVRGFGKTVRYKFDISNPNPDPTHHNGTTVWPNLYTLDPAVFNIMDTYEDRSGVSKSKRIGLVEEVDDKGIPNRFKKIKVHARRKGVLVFNLENEEEFQYAMYMELHPKLKNGKFADTKNKRQIIERVDEVAAAKDERAERSARKVAMDVAEKMTDNEIREFADAMAWDSGEELLNLRNMIENLAETEPKMFNDLVNSKKAKYQAAVKRAIDKGIWTLSPMDCKLAWASTSQTIIALGLSDSGRTDYERLGEWFMTAGKNADDAYAKLLSLEKAPEAVK